MVVPDLGGQLMHQVGGDYVQLPSASQDTGYQGRLRTGDGLEMKAEEEATSKNNLTGGAHIHVQPGPCSAGNRDGAGWGRGARVPLAASHGGAGCISGGSV